MADPEFPRGRQSPGSINLLFDQFSPKTARKRRKFWPGGRNLRPLDLPLKSVNILQDGTHLQHTPCFRPDTAMSS